MTRASMTAIEALALSPRTGFCLRRAGLQSVADVLARGEAGLQELRGFSSRCLMELRDRLAERGFLPAAGWDDEAVSEPALAGRRLTIAVVRDDIVAAAELLDDYGQDLQATVWLGRALHEAVIWSRPAIVEPLLAAGAALDGADQDRDPPLCVAARYGEQQIAGLLLRRGARLAVRGRHRGRWAPWGWQDATPLHEAAAAGHVAMASLLLDRGAPIDAVCEHRLTPLHVAALYGEPEVAALLLARGAAAGCRTQVGRTPLDLALERADHRLTKVLALGHANPPQPAAASARPPGD